MKGQCYLLSAEQASPYLMPWDNRLGPLGLSNCFISNQFTHDNLVDLYLTVASRNIPSFLLLAKQGNLTAKKPYIL